MRWRIAVLGGIAAALVLVACVLLHAPWYARLALFFPASVGFGSYLQVRRNTCVSRAREGTFERDDLSTTPAAAADAAASRVVARTINRDAVIFGVVCAGAAALL